MSMASTDFWPCGQLSERDLLPTIQLWTLVSDVKNNKHYKSYLISDSWLVHVTIAIKQWCDTNQYHSH